jgi:hypothetical protein
MREWCQTNLPTLCWLCSRLAIYWGTLVYFSWTVIASLIPLWLGLLMFIAYGHSWTWSLFYEKGEFYLYSTAYLANAIYLVRKQNAKEGGMHFIVTLSAALLLAIAAALYASLNTSQIIFGHNSGFTHPFLFISSLVLFGISIIFSLYALIVDFDPSKLPSNETVQLSQVNELERELDLEELNEDEPGHGESIRAAEHPAPADQPQSREPGQSPAAEHSAGELIGGGPQQRGTEPSADSPNGAPLEPRDQGMGEHQ